MFLFVSIISVAWFLWGGVEGRKDVITKELYKYLLADTEYQPDLLPVCEPGGFVNVSLDIALRQIVNLVRIHWLNDDDNRNHGDDDDDDVDDDDDDDDDESIMYTHVSYRKNNILRYTYVKE